MRSLSRRFLISVGLMSAVVTILGATAAFFVFQQDLTRRQIAFLGDYVRERSSNVERRFNKLSSLQAAAGVELATRYRHMTHAEAERLAEEYFPRRPDGTGRSTDEYFDGHKTFSGRWIYGMGAYISRRDQMTPEELRVMAAAFSVVSDFGQAAHIDYDNFYFFTPATRVAIFGPDRPDRLMFYRRQAPATLDISKEEMAQITLPGSDPTHATRCTNLQRLIQDTKGQRLATGCITPIYVDGRYVGSFGSTLELTGFFLNAVRTTLPGASNLVVTSKGELIASPGFDRPGMASEATVRTYEKSLGLNALVAAIRKDGRAHGVISSPDGRQIVAYGRLDGPDWYLMMTYPKAAVAQSAARSASWVLVLGALASLAQTILVVVLARRTIVRPLQDLAQSCAPDQADAAQTDAIEIRNDELGLLARALRAEREKTESVLASLEDRVQARTAELERANAEKSRFLANMSHELRTPLNGVIALSETLAGEQRTNRGRELASLIASSGRLLEQVLTDILDFSKIETGEIQLADEPFQMEVVVKRIAELHRAAAEAKGLTFSWHVAPEAQGGFRGDEVRLTQVLSNLLSNAVKFTVAGSVELKVSMAGDQVRFAVADTGIGFDEDVRARLFRRFEQADASIRRRFGGTGLGLAISRSLVELMGGGIDVVSVPGEGSTFAFLLPLARTSGAAASEPAGPQVRLDIAGARVLLAEDHPTNQKVVQLILQSVGIDPVIVENGALALAELREQTFDIVLMDMQMPELDGLSATAQLREYERAKGLAPTPVVMLTANALDEHVRASHDAGADRHLAKPIRAAVLLDTIVELMATRSAAPDQPLAQADQA